MHGEDWALVIQGPLHSPLPAKSWLRDIVESDDRFSPLSDCTTSILETVRRSRLREGHVVISTWSDPANAEAARSLSRQLGCQVVTSDDPGLGTWPLGRLPDNRQRQILSSLRGLEWVVDHLGASYVVRTRTDQVVDVASIIDAVEGNRHQRHRARQAGQLDFIYVAGAFVTVPYAIDDFYFAGRIEDVWRFFDAQWGLRSAYVGVDSVHSDLVVKHMVRNLDRAVGRPLSLQSYPVVDAQVDLDSRGHRTRLGARYLKRWCEVLATSLCPLPRQTYSGLVFRGVPFVLRHPRIFLEEWSTHIDDLGAYYRALAPEAFSPRPFGFPGIFLNYAPECAWMGETGRRGRLGRAVHDIRRRASGRYRGRVPERIVT